MSAVLGEYRATGRGYGRDEITIDCWLHVVAILAAIAGSAALIGAASQSGDRPVWPVGVYCLSMLLMFPCSAVYNLGRTSPRREILQRCDHAAIFLMIAGTYTPFTILAMRGSWALDMTTAVWLVALSGIGVKLVCPRLIERIDIPIYLAFGWGGLIILDWLDHPTAMLVALGGILYSIGAGFHLWRNLRFHQAIWHGFVVAAAACQYAAILHLVSSA